MADRDDELMIEYLLEDDGSAAPAPVTSPVAPPRRRRRRLIGLVAFLAAAGAAGVLVIGSPFEPSKPDRAANPLPAPGTALRIQLDRAGFGGPVGGSLAGDAPELGRIRDRVVALAVADDHALTTSKQVLVLWAGDLGAGRYADVLYSQPEGWSRVVLSGPARAAADQLVEVSWEDEERDLTFPLTEPRATFVNRPDDGGGGAVFVTAPTANGAEIAHARRFLPGGAVRTTWRPIKKQGGAVWAGLLDDNEVYLAGYRTAPAAFDDDRFPDVVDAPDGHAAARAIATGPAVGSPDGQDVIDCAADAARGVGASLAERPVLARVAALDDETVVAAVVLRSPDGGWIWGLCDQETGTDGAGSISSAQYPGASVAGERWRDADAVMAAQPAVLYPDPRTDEGPPRLVVLTPEGADHIRVAGRTAVVRDRLAEITLPRRTDLTSVTVEALRNGKALARVLPAQAN